MTALTWDQPEERLYQTGLDQGVLYLHDGTVVVWNGLTSVEEGSDIEVKEFHLDGVKYLETLVPGDFSGKLKALTYPDEFDTVNGIAHVASGSVGLGLDYYNQPPKSFNLSYRTLIGDPLEGTERGYKIHILYNVFANPDPYTFNTLKDSGAELTEFSWSLSGTPPPKIQGYRPTLHISIDSTKTPSTILRMLEDMLYGTASNEPHLPSIHEITELFGYLGALVIIDHGNGLWSAIDESDTYITMIDSTTFQIDNVNATYLDPETYQISSTNIDSGGTGP